MFGIFYCRDNYIRRAGFHFLFLSTKGLGETFCVWQALRDAQYIHKTHRIPIQDPQDLMGLKNKNIKESDFKLQLKHVYYSDGNSKKISWVLKTNDSIAEQKRDHAEIYLDKINCEQSKHIAFHVGLFWSIGTFRIKNGDTVLAMMDSKSMYENFSQNKMMDDPFIQTRTGFIKKLISQRKLEITFQLIDQNENLASKLLR